GTPTASLNNTGGLSTPTGVTTSLAMQGGSPVGAACLVSGNAAAAIEMSIEAGRRLSAEQEDVIKKLVYYQDEFESPSEDDIKKIAVSTNFLFIWFVSRKDSLLMF